MTSDMCESPALGHRATMPMPLARVTALNLATARSMMGSEKPGRMVSQTVNARNNLSRKNEPLVTIRPFMNPIVHLVSDNFIIEIETDRTVGLLGGSHSRTHGANGLVIDDKGRSSAGGLVNSPVAERQVVAVT